MVSVLLQSRRETITINYDLRSQFLFFILHHSFLSQRTHKKKYCSNAKGLHSLLSFFQRSSSTNDISSNNFKIFDIGRIYSRFLYVYAAFLSRYWETKNGASGKFTGFHVEARSRRLIISVAIGMSRGSIFISNFSQLNGQRRVVFSFHLSRNARGETESRTYIHTHARDRR